MKKFIIGSITVIGSLWLGGMNEHMLQHTYYYMPGFFTCVFIGTIGVFTMLSGIEE